MYACDDELGRLSYTSPRMLTGRCSCLPAHPGSSTLIRTSSCQCRSRKLVRHSTLARLFRCVSNGPRMLSGGSDGASPIRVTSKRSGCWASPSAQAIPAAPAPTTRTRFLFPSLVSFVCDEFRDIVVVLRTKGNNRRSPTTQRRVIYACLGVSIARLESCQHFSAGSERETS